MVFGVLAYGSLQDGLRYFNLAVAVIFLLWVLILSAMLVFQSGSQSGVVVTDSSTSGTASAIPEAPARPAPPPPVSTPARLPPLAEKGTSFHLDPGQSSPLFRDSYG